jgi:hypothetical protein
MEQVTGITLEVNGVVYERFNAFKEAPEVEPKDMSLHLTTNNLNELIDSLIKVRDERDSED